MDEELKKEAEDIKEETAQAEEAGAEAAAEGSESSAAEETSEAAGEEKTEKDPLTAAQEENKELNDRLLRQMAEFENFRKRTEKEKSAMFDMGARTVIEKILPVIDNFERGLDGVPAEAKNDPFVDGMDKIYKQLMKELTDLGVKPIEAKGQPFNPDLHNAVMHIDDDTIDENTVVEEFQKGYTFRDSIVRYSMVKVAN
ncbi:MAG: nucleotide exchange factor GrpE [Lachnospiraceae bacterium]|nr:nucleotide exchange factor GrpE [Lachnospiraceae bacterium]